MRESRSEKVKIGTEESLPKHLVEKRNVLIGRERHTVSTFYFQIEER